MSDALRLPDIPDDELISKIHLIRGKKVMLDHDLAVLYGVETKRLNEQVRRNPDRFPAHYRFELTPEERESLRSQNATLKRGAHSKYGVSAFTEHGVLMLSNVLKSAYAIQVSIRIIHVFVKLREMMLSQYEIKQELQEIRQRLDEHDAGFAEVMIWLDRLIQKQPKEQTEKVGFRIPNTD